MSVDLGQNGPTPYITIAGTQLPLPPSARLDLAYQWSFSRPANSVTPIRDIVAVPGTYIEIVLSVSTFLTTSSTVATRYVLVNFDVTDLAAVQVSAPFTQGASLGVSYNFMVGSSAYGGSNTLGGFAPLPAIALLPGSSWFVGAEFAVTGDVMGMMSATTIRIPTGPNAARPTQPDPLAVPLLT